MMKTVLEEASEVVADRHASYGHPYDNLSDVAKMWSGLFCVDISAEDVALAMILVKVCREKNMHKLDNLIDIAGYTQCIQDIKDIRAGI